MIKKEYKDYTIIIEKQKPSVTKPETEEEWDKHFETHGGETKGTHKYKVVIKKTWSLDSIKIYLTNDKGDEVILNSGDLNRLYYE
jgi:hypothetical protein